MSRGRVRCPPPRSAILLQRTCSYFADDLVVLTWDRAFIYEPRGDSDVADVIEVANDTTIRPNDCRRNER